MAILAADQQLVRTDVQRAQVDDALHAGRGLQGQLDRGHLLRQGGLADQHRRHLHRQEDRDDDEQRADRHGADGVPPAVTGEHGHADAEEREHQPDQGTGVLEQDHRQLGLAGGPDEARQRARRRGERFASLMAVRKENDSSPIATTSTTTAIHQSSSGSGCCHLCRPS